MAESTILTSPAQRRAILVTLRWGMNNEVRYAKYTEDISLPGPLEGVIELFTAEPTLEMSLDGGLHGGTDATTLNIQMRNSVPPFTTLCRPYPHAPVSVLVEEYSPDEDVRASLFEGDIVKVVDCPRGKRGIAKAVVTNYKARLSIPLGIQATTTCQWSFGDCNCGKDVPMSTGTITALNDSNEINWIKVTFDTPPTLSSELWKCGFVEVDGCRLLIRQFQETNSVFELDQVPPPEWEGQAAYFVRGCSKTIACCRLWNNEIQFGGFGFAMPPRNPVFEGV